MWAFKRKKKVHPNVDAASDKDIESSRTKQNLHQHHHHQQQQQQQKQHQLQLHQQNQNQKAAAETFVRVNGWSSPFHPLQLLAWFFLIFFSVTYFIFMIPNLPTSQTKWIAGCINGVIFIFHIIIYLTSTTVNPADDAVIAKYGENNGRKSNSNKVKPAKFDRSKHEHVIENQFCYICEVSVGSKAKHCSACNKCVSRFDHHCKWLNNCVGGKNYK